ncbi:MAG TPA: choice-of-anchor Q domain-containing protein [Gemmataceae bacterium]|nr:choice-of-anchor Q domain-containing protein [Gemmataceae bacterium]
MSFPYLPRWLGKQSQGSQTIGRPGQRPKKGFRPRLEILEDRLAPATLTVINTNDSGTGSLRAAISAANSGDTINFDPVSFATPRTITLTSGQLTLLTSMSITGSAAGVTVSGNQASRVFQIGDNGSNGPTVTLTGLTITQGQANSAGGGILELAGSTLILDGCTVSNNLSPSDGGGLFVYSSTATLTNCTFTGNSSETFGGAIKNYGGQMTATNCTIAGNSVANSAGGGSGVENNGTTDLYNNIVANNGGADDLGSNGPLMGSHNLIKDGTHGLASPVSGDPMLGPLQNNGGPTYTMALLPGSAALDAGSNSLVPTGVTADQRGAARIVNGTVDIGAFEVQSTTTVVSLQGGTQNYGSSPTLRATVMQGGSPVTSGTVTFLDGTTTLASGLVVVAGIASTVLNNPSSGIHTIRAVYSGGTGFEASGGSFSLTVNPLSIMVTANAQSKTYGNPDPTLTYQITSGFLVPGDSFSGSLSRAAGENVGSYPIAKGSLTAGSNYALTYVGASFTITPASTSLVLACSANPSVPGQFLSLTATVTALASNAVPTGVVDFYDQTTHTDLGSLPLSGGSATLSTAAVAALGSHTLAATYSNSDHNFTPPSSPTTLSQLVQGVVRESLGGSAAVLYVGGTPGSNHIEVQLNGAQVTVMLHDGSPDFQTPLTGLSSLVVYGHGDKEHIQVDHQLMLPAFLFAGDGADTHLEGGGGPTVEVGGKGGGHLEGGSGRNILIAGHGGGHLEGHGSDDILIGGYTDYDANLAALQAILAEWNSTDSFSTRTRVLGSYFNTSTVHDNGVADHLEGGGGQNWFFASIQDKLDGNKPGDLVVGI